MRWCADKDLMRWCAKLSNSPIALCRNFIVREVAANMPFLFHFLSFIFMAKQLTNRLQDPAHLQFSLLVESPFFVF